MVSIQYDLERVALLKQKMDRVAVQNVAQAISCIYSTRLAYNFV